MTVTPSEPIAQQLRRRRYASRRCETLADGRRDPIDPAPTEPPPLVVEVIARSVRFEDRPIVRAAVRTLRPRWQFDRVRRAIVCPHADAADVLAFIEHRGVRVELINLATDQ